MKLSKLKLELLERAFKAKIDSAHHRGPGIIKSTSPVAAQLAEEGLLDRAKVMWHGNIIEGFRLNDSGRIAYCEQALIELGIHIGSSLAYTLNLKNQNDTLSPS